MAYDFKRLVFGTLLFTTTVYVLLLIIATAGANYDMNMSELTGEIFEEDNWIFGTESAYIEAADIHTASVTASVTDLDVPTSSKSLFDKASQFALDPFKIIFNVLGAMFHVPAPVMWTLATILLLEIILVVWRLLKQGD